MPVASVCATVEMSPPAPSRCHPHRPGGTLMRRVALLCVVLLVVSVAPLRLAHADNPSITIAVDVALNRHSIDPLIYGTAYADPSQLTDLNSPLNRRGGNPTSRYNWQVNADNRAFDYF